MNLDLVCTNIKQATLKCKIVQIITACVPSEQLKVATVLLSQGGRTIIQMDCWNVYLKQARTDGWTVGDTLSCEAVNIKRVRNLKFFEIQFFSQNG